MTLKNVSGIVGTLPGVLYFVQEDTDWYSNEAGKEEGYIFSPLDKSNKKDPARLFKGCKRSYHEM